MFVHFLIILLAWFGIAAAPIHNHDPHASTHVITITSTLDSARCSATAIGPHALLTAEHCMLGTDLIQIDGQDHIILRTVYDHSDHVILYIDTRFYNWVSVYQNAVESGQIEMWGNPGKSRSVYRVGGFVGKDTDEDGHKLLMFLLPAFAGDSGAGLFDSYGRVVAVLTYADVNARTACLVMNFTPEQLVDAGR